MSQIFTGLTALGTGTGAKALSVGAMTDTVKLSFLEVSSAVTAGTVIASQRHGIGVADGTTQRAYCALSENGVSAGAADNGGRHDTASVINMTLTTGTPVEGEASHTSFGAGTHNINIDDAFTTSLLAKHTFFGGADISVAIRDVTGDADNGDFVDVSDCGFDPNFAIIFGRGNTAPAADFNWNAKSLILGYAVKTSAGAAEQFCYGDSVPNGQTNYRSIFRSDRCAARVTAGANQGTLELSWISGGARFTTRDAPTTDSVSVVVAFVRLPTRRLRAMSSVFDTNGTGNKTVTSVGFRPAAYFCVGTGLAALDTAETGSGTSKYSNACYDQAGNIALIGQQAEDAATTTDTRSVASTTQIARVLDDAGADAWSASHVSLDPDGITINIDSASAADRAVGFVFFSADEATSVQNETINVSETTVLLGAGTLVASETVEVSETTVLLGAGTLVADETIEISETSVLVAQGDQLIVVDETVEVSESTVLLAAESLITSETVEVSETAVLVLSNMATIVADETIEVSESIVALFSALQVDEEIEVSEQINFRGTGVGAVVDETIEISESVYAWLGEILIANETVEISEQVNFGDGPDSGKSDSGKGGTVQGGAQLGKTYQGGARYGGTVS